jgi:hypothetical protein
MIPFGSLSNLYDGSRRSSAESADTLHPLVSVTDMTSASSASKRHKSGRRASKLSKGTEFHSALSGGPLTLGDSGDSSEGKTWLSKSKGKKAQGYQALPGGEGHTDLGHSSCAGSSHHHGHDGHDGHDHHHGHSHGSDTHTHSHGHESRCDGHGEGNPPYFDHLLSPVPPSLSSRIATRLSPFIPDEIKSAYSATSDCLGSAVETTRQAYSDTTACIGATAASTGRKIDYGRRKIAPYLPAGPTDPCGPETPFVCCLYDAALTMCPVESREDNRSTHGDEPWMDEYTSHRRPPPPGECLPGCTEDWQGGEPLNHSHG